MQTDKLSFKDALLALKEGHKVKLPEWTGYWFTINKTINIFCKNGDIVEGLSFPGFETRQDWQITDGKMGFDFALNALKNDHLLTRTSWNDTDRYIFLHDAKPDYEDARQIIMKNYATGRRQAYIITQDDILANDWEVIRD